MPHTTGTRISDSAARPQGSARPEATRGLGGLDNRRRRGIGIAVEQANQTPGARLINSPLVRWLTSFPRWPGRRGWQ